jgi:hypothetical protein
MDESKADKYLKKKGSMERRIEIEEKSQQSILA